MPEIKENNIKEDKTKLYIDIDIDKVEYEMTRDEADRVVQETILYMLRVAYYLKINNNTKIDLFK